MSLQLKKMKFTRILSAITSKDLSLSYNPNTDDISSNLLEWHDINSCSSQYMHYNYNSRLL